MPDEDRDYPVEVIERCVEALTTIDSDLAEYESNVGEPPTAILDYLRSRFPEAIKKLAGNVWLQPGYRLESEDDDA